MPALFRPVARCHHHRAGAVRFLAAVEQAVGIGNHPRSLMLLESERAPIHDRAGVALGIGIGIDGHQPHLLGSGAVKVHVAARVERIHLRRRHQAEGRRECLPRRSVVLQRAGMRAIPAARLAVADLSLRDRPVTHHDAGGFRRHRHRRVLDHAGRGISASRIEVREAQPQAELFRDFENRAAVAVIGAQPIHFIEAEARIGDRALDRLASQRHLAAAGPAPFGIGCLADAEDRRLVTKLTNHVQTDLLSHLDDGTSQRCINPRRRLAAFDGQRPREPRPCADVYLIGICLHLDDLAPRQRGNRTTGAAKVGKIDDRYQGD
jgi:hypothetical protein